MVLVISIPRSGTHLVMRLLTLLGETPEFGGHLFYDKNYNKKAIYIERDLRDVVVSLVDFFKNRNKVHPARDYVNNSEDPFSTVILGGHEKLPSMKKRKINTEGWKKHPLVYTTSFERLKNDLDTEVKNICNHFNIKYKKIKEEILFGKHPPYEQNFNKGEIGNWKNYLEPHHIELMKSEGLI